MTFCSATYSPEDNKLRIYPEDPDQRLDADLYQRLRDAGFIRAPKQGLFVAPAWTPDREDLCIELVGEIVAEETSLVERAAAKAERLDALAEKRSRESSRYHEAANRISERFAFGQPILVGHHSERKARADQKRMHSAMDKALAAHKAVSYWNYRAEGVERHANYKSSPAVRARRIKTLLAELRDQQRDLNHGGICLDLWRSIEKKQESDNFKSLVIHWAGVYLKTGSATPYLRESSIQQMVESGELSPLEAVEQCIRHFEYVANNPVKLRWIEHILNRLEYERDELGPVARYTGELTPVILQTFCRTHGAMSPKASKTADGFTVKASAPLPFHIGEGHSVELSADAWRDLMQSVGYEVPEKRPAKVSILNFRCQSIRGRGYGGVQDYPQIEMTKAEYSEVYSDYRGVRESECGTFRFKTVWKNRGLYSVYLTDSKTHEAPESSAVTYVGDVA